MILTPTQYFALGALSVCVLDAVVGLLRRAVLKDLSKEKP